MRRGTVAGLAASSIGGGADGDLALGLCVTLWWKSGGGHGDVWGKWGAREGEWRQKDGWASLLDLETMLATQCFPTNPCVHYHYSYLFVLEEEIKVE